MKSTKAGSGVDHQVQRTTNLYQQLPFGSTLTDSPLHWNNQWSIAPLGGFTPLQSNTLSTVAHGLGATPMQVAIAWLLQRSPNVPMIPGTSSVAHLHDNLAAAQLHLPADALAQLNAIATPAA